MIADRFDHLFISPRDYDASVAFYVEKLGWEVSETWQSEEGTRCCELSSSGVKLVLAERSTSSGRGASHPWDANESGAGADGRLMLHLDIHNLQKRFDQVPRGEHVVRQPEPQKIGPDWFVLKDPDGNLIAFNDRRQKN